MLERRRLFGYGWLALALALGLHVADEAAHDFLGMYNPIARAAQERVGLPFPPVFTFPVWLGGLILGVAALLACTPLAFRSSRRLAWLALPLGLIMVANGVGHLGMSLVSGRWVAGALSSPLLLACALVLLVAAWRVLRAPRPGLA